MTIPPWCVLGICTLGLGSCLACAETGRGLVAAPESFNVRGTVIESRDVSSITRGDHNLGLIAADEGATIQILRFDADQEGAEIVANIQLGDRPTEEIDFEASTFLDGWYYVSGSHGTSRRRGNYSPARAQIFRFRLNAEGNGLAEVEAGSLARILDAHPELARHHRRPLQERGINIEGMAALGGMLYVGFRAPNLDGNAHVLRITPGAPFSEEPDSGELLRIPLGPGLGIRGMTATRTGLLMIAGNAGARPNRRFPAALDFTEERPSELILWNAKDATVRHLATLPRPAGGEAEGIHLIAENEDGSLEFVIVHDGIPGGAFQRFRYSP